MRKFWKNQGTSGGPLGTPYNTPSRGEGGVGFNRLFTRKIPRDAPEICIYSMNYLQFLGLASEGSGNQDSKF